MKTQTPARTIRILRLMNKRQAALQHAIDVYRQGLREGESLNSFVQRIVSAGTPMEYE